MASTLKDDKTKWKLFRVFERPQKISTNDGPVQEKKLPLHQFKNFNACYAHPYILYTENTTNLCYVGEGGVFKRVFQPFTDKVFFTKAEKKKDDGWVCM